MKRIEIYRRDATTSTVVTAYRHGRRIWITDHLTPGDSYWYDALSTQDAVRCMDDHLANWHDQYNDPTSYGMSITL